MATLRELGLGHAEVRAVLDHRRTVAEVAATHVAALDAQITTLRLRRAVLSAIAAGNREQQGDMDRLNRMARASAQERQRIIDDFAAHVCEGLDPAPRLVERLRVSGHLLPYNPTQEQFDAWLELSEMTQDQDFEQFAGTALAASMDARHTEPDRHRLFAESLENTVGAALRDGLAPNAPGAAEVVSRLLGDPGPERRAAVRARLRAQLDAGVDDRPQRYRRLLAVMQGRRPPTSRVAAYTWLAVALDAD